MPNQYTDPIPIEERFWPKVDRSGGPDACWLWGAALDDKGYGRFTGTKPYMLAHRIAWELTHGPIPGDFCVLHNCPDGDNPRCVNPSHLWLGTQLDNVADRDAKGRTAIGERSGMHTHPESRPSGERHGSRTKPERLARGEKNGMNTHPERRPRGETSGAAKLTQEQIDALRAAYATGTRTQMSLAREYGIRQSHVSRIILRLSWRE